MVKITKATKGATHTRWKLRCAKDGWREAIQTCEKIGGRLIPVFLSLLVMLVCAAKASAFQGEGGLEGGRTEMQGPKEEARFRERGEEGGKLERVLPQPRIGLFRNETKVLVMPWYSLWFAEFPEGDSGKGEREGDRDGWMEGAAEGAEGRSNEQSGGEFMLRNNIRLRVKNPL